MAEGKVKNAVKKMSSAGALDWLKNVNDFLEQVPISILGYFDNLAKSAEQMAQKHVDIICRWLAWKVNLMVERKRQEVVKWLYDQYGFYLQLAQVLGPLKASSSPGASPTSILKALLCLLDPFLKPMKVILGFLQTLMIEIPRLAKNLAKIAEALPPTPPNPNINYDEFKLKIGTISIKEIMMGPDGMPTPEEMFPEPMRPFGKEFFNAAFSDAKGIASKDKLKEYLPKQGTIADKINNKVN